MIDYFLVTFEVSCIFCDENWLEPKIKPPNLIKHVLIPDTYNAHDTCGSIRSIFHNLHFLLYFLGSCRNEYRSAVALPAPENKNE